MSMHTIDTAMTITKVSLQVKGFNVKGQWNGSTYVLYCTNPDFVLSTEPNGDMTLSTKIETPTEDGRTNTTGQTMTSNLFEEGMNTPQDILDWIVWALDTDS